MKQTKLSFSLPDHETEVDLPMFNTHVKAGFPSPADDSIDEKLDLNRLMIKHPAATFFVRVEGESMRDANIHSGDILVVDRAVSPLSSMIVIAILNGEFTVKRISIEKNQVTLHPENDQFTPLKITPEMDFEIWGVVTYIVHKCPH